MDGPDSAPDQPLLVSSPYQFYRPQKKDRAWSVAFYLVWLACICAGFVAYSHRNPHYLEHITPEYLSDPSHCPINAPRGRLLRADDHEHSNFEFGEFWSNTATWLFISVISSLMLGLAFLGIVRHHAFSLARATIAFQISMPLVLALGLLLNGRAWESLGAWFLTGVTAAVFYMWRNEVIASTKLLSVSGHALADNMSLIGLPVGLNIVTLFSMIPLFIVAAIGYSNGDVYPNPERVSGETCVSATTGQEVACCVWTPDNWIPYLWGAVGITATWTIFTLHQIRVFIVSDVTSQWYFGTAGSSTKGNLGRAVSHAVGPSLGSNIFAGAVMALTQSVQQENQQNQQNGDFSFFGFVTSIIASALEYLTKFAVVFSAITGESLLDAGRHCTDLLVRNFLTAIATTVWFPSALMSLASVTMSMLWGTAVGVGYKYLHNGGSTELHHESNALVLGLTAGVTALVVLSFLVGVLLSILDAVFVCWALDRDRAMVSNDEVYQAFVAIATEKGAIPPLGEAYVDETTR